MSDLREVVQHFLNEAAHLSLAYEKGMLGSDEVNTRLWDEVKKFEQEVEKLAGQD